MLKMIFKMFYWLMVRLLKTFTGLFSIVWFFTKRLVIGFLIFLAVMVLKSFWKKG